MLTVHKTKGRNFPFKFWNAKWPIMKSLNYPNIMVFFMEKIDILPQSLKISLIHLSFLF